MNLMREVMDNETGEVRLELIRSYDGDVFKNRWQMLTQYRGMMVSTVFLVIEHSGGFYETFDGIDIVARYPTRAKAIEGHKAVVASRSWGVPIDELVTKVNDPLAPFAAPVVLAPALSSQLLTPSGPPEDPDEFDALDFILST